MSQLNLLQGCSIFISHQGSSAVKAAYLLGLPTLCHGPNIIANEKDTSLRSCKVIGWNLNVGYRLGSLTPCVYLPNSAISRAAKEGPSDVQVTKECDYNYRVDPNMLANHAIEILETSWKLS
jgi:hypothetical protein